MSVTDAMETLSGKRCPLGYKVQKEEEQASHRAVGAVETIALGMAFSVPPHSELVGRGQYSVGERLEWSPEVWQGPPQPHTWGVGACCGSPDFLSWPSTWLLWVQKVILPSPTLLEPLPHKLPFLVFQKDSHYPQLFGTLTEALSSLGSPRVAAYLAPPWPSWESKTLLW